MEEDAMQSTKEKTAITLPPLPYPENALEPVISARTLSFHYGKHHAGYVATLNKLIEGTAYAGRPLAEIVQQSARERTAVKIFRNAAQAWNHDFYWRSMRSRGGGEPAGRLKQAIAASFGNAADFRRAFAKAAVEHFGSGWVWLVAERDGKLAIAATDNADTPIVDGRRPLITLDLWEHAYYLDYQNRRADYVEAWLDKLADWRFAEEALG
jgi:superoxide dismutase, Fe-Mn family